MLVSKTDAWLVYQRFEPQQVFLKIYAGIFQNVSKNRDHFTIL